MNLHIETGLANAISLLHNAREGGSPMVVTSGNKDIRELAHERTDLAAMVEQFTKWTAEATYPEQVPFFLRRAFNEAKTPPTGPTFVGFSANSMDNEADVDIFASAEGYHRTAPDAQAVEKAASILAEASNPLMIISDRIAQAGASEEAVRVAELLGCPVHTTIMHSEFNFPGEPSTVPRWYPIGVSRGGRDGQQGRRCPARRQDGDGGTTCSRSRAWTTSGRIPS